MKPALLILFTILLAAADPAWSAGYQYIPAAQLNERLDSESSMILIDISPAALFAKKHIPGSIGTQAYPVKTITEKLRLDNMLPLIEASGEADIIIICPRGGHSAQRAFDHFKTQGVHPNRLKILAGGILAWPYASGVASE